MNIGRENICGKYQNIRPLPQICGNGLKRVHKRPRGFIEVQNLYNNFFYNPPKRTRMPPCIPHKHV